ncbi:MAG TPA: FecR domain-containing protein [Gemmatimonadales bacterium]
MTAPPPLPPPESSVDPLTVGRYLDGRASAEERAVVERWASEGGPERQAALSALRVSWQAEARRLGAAFDVDAAWARFRSARRTSDRAFARPQRARLVAGVVAVVLGAGGLWWLISAPRFVSRAPAMREYVTPRGRRAVFRLLDGTEITLNADTRIRAPLAFEGRAERAVYIDGEAYFRVAHDAARPFVVHTASGAIRDVGTAFGVRAYADETRERVAVIEGSVALAETTLHAGQVASRSRGDGAVRLLRGAKAADAVAWTRGRLVFASVPLAEAAQQLSRWYDLDVRVADSPLAARPVTGSYGDEPVVQVLTLITAAVGARFEWHGRSVTISRSHGPR